jgi:hypothetical protein
MILKRYPLGDPRWAENEQKRQAAVEAYRRAVKTDGRAEWEYATNIVWEDA